MNWRIKNFVKGIKNLIYFFSVVWKYQWWDYTFSLDIFKRSLEQYPEKYRKNGMETDYSLNPKIEQMTRIIELLTIEVNGSHMEVVEKEMGFEYLDDVGEEKHTKMHYKIMELEEEYWNEIWNIIKGSKTDGTSKYIKRLNMCEDEKIKDQMDYVYDGTDMRGWWD